MKKNMKKIAKGIVFAVFAAVALSVSVSAQVDENDKAVVDYSKSPDTGTVSIKLKSKTDAKIMVRIEKGTEKYDYSLRNDGNAEFFPLQMGNGDYSVKVCTEVPGKGYAQTLASTYKHQAKNENAVFLNPSQYVNYSKDSKITKKASELTKDLKTDIDKAGAIYEFVIDSLKYDTDKANKAQTGAMAGYVPVVDDIISAGKGICFDYATVFAAMLRSQGIPARLVMGNVANPTPGASAGSTVYHAWNEFFSKEKGTWVKINEMQFSGGKFERLDPTFDSSNRGSKAAMQFIGDGTNYQKFKVY